MRQTVAPQRGAWVIEATLGPESLLDEFTKASGSRIRETSSNGANILFSADRGMEGKVGPSVKVDPYYHSDTDMNCSQTN